MIKYDHDKVFENREYFIRYNRLKDPDAIPQEVLDSWRRSAAAGVDPYLSKLPPRQSTETIYRLLDEQIVYEKSYCLQWLQSGYSHLSKMHAALFLATQKEKVILVRGGCKELRDKLKTRNFGIGALLTVESAGTNVVEFASTNPGSKNWIIGAQHWLEAFMDFVFVSTPIITETGICYIILVTELVNFNVQTQAFFEFFIDNYARYVESQNQKMSYMNELINLSIDQNKSATIFIDEEGIIFYVNKKMTGILGLPPKKIIGMRIHNFLPGIKNIFSKEHGLISIHEMKIGKEKYFMDIHPIYKDSKQAGYTVTLTEYSEFSEVIERKDIKYKFDDLMGVSPSFLKNKSTALKAARSSSTVLITGESGTGKELFAQAIHNESARGDGPFIAVNCAAIPKELIGSELFGYMGGAFTGARKEGNAGKFEMADKGTLFLDEIGDMPLDMQTALLRALEERSFTRIGSSRQIRVDVRLIAATNKDLRELINEGKFRLDLYYRLNVIRLELSPLRERKEDISYLLHYFIHYYNSVLDNTIRGMDKRAMNTLLKYDWPGNIRQLRNAVESAINVAEGKYITCADLGDEIVYGTPDVSALKELQDFFHSEEHQLIDKLMTKHNGNKSRVAQELGIARTTLYKKLNLYHVK